MEAEVHMNSAKSQISLVICPFAVSFKKYYMSNDHLKVLNYAKRMTIIILFES